MENFKEYFDSAIMMITGHDFDPVLLLKAIVSVFGLMLGIMGGRHVITRSHARLKADLEIRNLLGREDPYYRTIDLQVHRTIKNIYSGPRRPERDLKWKVTLAISLMLATAFGGWTIALVS